MDKLDLHPINLRVRICDMYLYVSCMNVAVLELHSHDKRPNPCTLRWSTGPSHRSYNIAIMYRRQPTIWLHDPFLQVLTVNGNELRVSGIAAVCTTFKVFSHDVVLAKHKGRVRASRITHKVYQGRASNP